MPEDMGEWSCSSTFLHPPASLLPGKDLRYPLDRRVDGPQIWSVRCGGKKHLHFHPACSLSLYRLSYSDSWKYLKNLTQFESIYLFQRKLYRNYYKIVLLLVYVYTILVHCTCVIWLIKKVLQINTIFIPIFFINTAFHIKQRFKIAIYASCLKTAFAQFFIVIISCLIWYVELLYCSFCKPHWTARKRSKDSRRHKFLEDLLFLTSCMKIKYDKV
jgi:hypothetical protein